MAPLIKKAKDNDSFDVKVCATAQHRKMLDQVLNFFEIVPDFDLNIMQSNQDLFDLTSRLLSGLKPIVLELKPDIILVQGDTTTTFVASLAGFYTKTKIAHIESGLRSYDKFSPFPEEVNRLIVSNLADYHFAPTETNAKNLSKENIKDNVFVVGNTVVDALFMGLDLIKKHGEASYYNYFNFVDFSKKIILVTGHRRENFGKSFEEICNALKQIAEENQDVQLVYPVHLNPNVQEPVNKILSALPNFFLIEPLSYPHFIWLMSKSYLIITDSGGLQEEAPSLGKPVIITRKVTERIEGIEAGTAKLVGTSTNIIIEEVSRLINDRNYYISMSTSHNPYGDGKSSERIVRFLVQATM